MGKFEEERAKLDNAREVFHNALEFYGDDEEQVEKAQAVSHIRQNGDEAEGVPACKGDIQGEFFFGCLYTPSMHLLTPLNVPFQFLLSRIPCFKSSALYAAYTKFEKQHGIYGFVLTVH